MNINITALFVCIDDFCKIYEKAQLTKLLPSDKKRNRGSFLCLSEMLFIEILYHFSGFRTFKTRVMDKQEVLSFPFFCLLSLSK